MHDPETTDPRTAAEIIARASAWHDANRAWLDAAAARRVALRRLEGRD